MEANFRSVTFGREVNFSNSTFHRDANFSGATFEQAAGFYNSTFQSRANFTGATFGAAAEFFAALFNAPAKFGGATFRAEAQFVSAKFAAELEFKGGSKPTFDRSSSLDLRFIRTERPESVSFVSLTLRPHWFVNTNPRNYDFVDVDWNFRVNEEIDRLKRKNVPLPHRMLSIACRRLAANAEEGNRFEEASRFRYLTMDARRREDFGGFAPWRMSWWYWLASGYGERAWQAFLVLLAILLISAAFYSRVGFARWEPRLASESDAATAKRDEVGRPMPPSRVLGYSAAVMTLQKPEPRPATTAAQTVVLLETILGPVQAALLALAIRRKFMR